MTTMAIGATHPHFLRSRPVFTDGYQGTTDGDDWCGTPGPVALRKPVKESVNVLQLFSAHGLSPAQLWLNSLNFV